MASKTKIYCLSESKGVGASSYLVDCGGDQILIDCGLYQGKEYEKLNYDKFRFDPADLKAVLITHSHIDHTGRLPLLAKRGFSKKIYSTPPTKDFADLMLRDTQGLLADDAEKNREEELYSAADIDKSMSLWETVEYHKEVEISPKFSFAFYNAGHVLGSCIILLKIKTSPKKEIRVIFSGDLGNPQNQLLPEMEELSEGDYCFVESTYGNRLHENLDQRKNLLEDTIEEAVMNKGVLMIPTFAMERTQELLFELNELVENKRIQQIPIFIDSPLAIKLTEVYQKYLTYFRLDAFKSVSNASDNFFDFPGLKFTMSSEESKAIATVLPPKLVMAGSGSSQGGRILHHEKNYLPDPNNILLIVGYQMAGTLGRKLVDGEKVVNIYGEKVSVNAKVKEISAYSAHADQSMLLGWIKPMRFTLKKVFVVHGDPEAREVLSSKIRDLFGLLTESPDHDSIIELDDSN
ncbi:MAG TPA: MBL fold metallo-hydrolase [Candidatus Paceibacterota bacterium]|nr:MBL fold metallo-hydrolase [Candidatus Paceibacterota bacterium]